MLTPAQAGKDYRKGEGRISPSALVKMKARAYAIPLDKPDPHASRSFDGRIPLGTVSYTSSTESPGVPVGGTWYDYQQSCSMGRMIGIGPHSGETGPSTVHFGWTRLPDSVFVARSFAYNAYISATHSFVGETILHDPDMVYSGFVQVDVTPDNRALLGGNCDLLKGPTQGYQTQIHFDDCSACADFTYYTRVPDSVAGYHQDPQDGDEALMPKIFYQFGSDTVLHAFSIISSTTALQALMYFRQVDPEGSGEWDYPPRVVDSVIGIAHDITGTRTGDRVALAWLANPPYQEPECDTCSGLTIYDGYLIGQMDNDVYVQISDDQGISWEPRQNITNVGIGQAAFKAYCDLSILFDQSGYLHTVWNATPWTADTCIESGGFCFEGEFYPSASRIFHWSENMPYNRTITDHTYPPSDSCGPPMWAPTVAKMTLSECDGWLYCIWSQFNDVPNGILNDCAQWVFDQGVYYGGANADIWLAGSADGGLSWCNLGNLTNSYTPHCEAGDCQSDYYASMTRWGRQTETGEDWSGTVTVDPSGGAFPTNHYLDIQYLNDLDAGSVVGAEGSWTYSNIKWFRVPCVQQVPCEDPNLCLRYMPGSFSEWAAVHTQKDVSLTIENLSASAVTYDITVEEDNGPEGWLGVSGFSGYIPCFENNTETGTVHLNQNGVCLQAADLTGRLIVTSDASCSPDTVPVELMVVEGLPVWETVNSSCLSLTVNRFGNMGRGGWGGANMDYYPEDCDSTATVYMYEGTHLLARNGGADWNYLIWGNDWYDETGWRPLSSVEGPHTHKPCAGLNAEVFETGLFRTPDSNVAFERIYVAPADDCEFILAYMRVWPGEGQAQSDLLIGEMFDWDVPNDNNPDDPGRDGHSINSGGIDASRNMLYLQGFECYCDDTLYPHNCVYNDSRFAGHAFVQSYLNGSPRYSIPYSGFVGELDEMADSYQGFIQSVMWTELSTSGLRGSDSTEDLASAMCFEPSLSLDATDYYEVVTVMATLETGTLADFQAAIDRGKTWFVDRGGISMFADANADGQIDLCEGCCMIMGDISHSGQVDVLDIIFFVDWLWKPGSPDIPCPEEADCTGDEEINALDLICFVDWFFHGIGSPGECP
ncbi:MAG: hypothetical protein JSW34_02970, partial [Candidatus Zixiibacteriota bacterium]